MFRKPFGKPATYRKREESIGITDEPITTDTREQLDYTLTSRTWKNSIKNTESDTKANLDSDPYPAIDTIQIKLTPSKPKGEGRNRYKKRNEEQHNTVNNILIENSLEHHTIKNG